MVDPVRSSVINRATVLFAAWVCLDAAISIYLVAYGIGTASRLLLIAGIVLFGYVAIRGGGPGGRGIDAMATAVVAVQCAIFLVFPFRADPGPPPPADVYRIFPAVALIGLGVAGGLTAVRRRRGRSTASALTAALVVAIAIGILFRAVILLTDTPPFFDVFYIQEAAGQALLEGIDPYLTQVWVNGYLYLPLAAISAAAGELIGDARWAGIAGDLMVVAALPLFARRVGASRRTGLALAAVWVWWAAGLYIVWQGFPEPVLIGFAALAAVALAGEAPRTVLAGVLVGLAAATKQFGLGLIPFLPLGRGGWKAVVAAGATWLIVVVPFALWHPDRFFEGALFSLVREPARDYAFNVLNWPGVSIDPPLALVFVISLAFGWVCQRRQDSPVEAWLAGSVGLFLAAFALNRIAFVNYYAIPMALMLFLILAYAGRRPPHTEVG
jgi:glycosyl transferase family 87